MKSPDSPDFTQPIPGYEVQELLGAGGMGSVYRARHKGLDRMVALKVLRRDQIDPGLALARLTKEARVLARLDHPAIVRSIDFGESGDLVYFVMELIEGKSCKQLLIERGPFSVREAVVIGERVAQALGHAAKHGVIHRDVKPGNILLGKDGSVKLTDFGLARATRDRSLTQDGITVGTPQYMSPEQVRSPRRVDLRSDLYSLGATLYHLVTGEPPLRGETVGEILHEVLYSTPRPPEQLVPTLPASFSRVLARLLAKDVRRRYSSVEELLADFARVRAGLITGGDERGDGDERDEVDPGGEPVGLSWQEAAEAPPRSYRGWWMAGAALLVASVAWAALWETRGGHAPSPADLRSREEEMIGALERQWRTGGLLSSEVLSRLGELRRDGQLTPASSLARVDLKAAAATALEAEVRAAGEAARTAAWTALQRGDFAAAHAALDQGLPAAFLRIIPTAAKSGLETAEVEVSQWTGAAAAAAQTRLDDLERSLRSAIHQELLRLRSQLAEEVHVALESLHFATAKAALGRYAEAETAAFAAITRTVLRAAGSAISDAVPDDEIARGWPERVRSEVKFEPASSLVSIMEDELARRAEQEQRKVRLEIQRAAETVAAEIAAGRTSVDVPGVRSEVEASLSEPLAGLAGIGALPPELEADWSALARAVEEADLESRLEREAAARTRLVDGEAKRPGIVALICERQLAEACVALSASGDLAVGELAQWSEVVEDVTAALTRAGADLRARAGQEVDLRVRSGVGVRGKLSFDPGQETFSVGTRRGLRIEDLDLASLMPAIEAVVADPAHSVHVRFLLGDEKERAALGAELEARGRGPVADVLRKALAEQAQGEASRKEKHESLANDCRSAFDAALEKGDSVVARKKWRELLKLADTAAGRAALADRARVEQAIDAKERDGRRKRRLDEVTPHAKVREVGTDGAVHVVYPFAQTAEGEDFQLFGNAVRVDNHRLFFAGGESGRSGAEYGATLAFPLDRKAPASLRVELIPTLDEPKDPHYVGLRLGPACCAFYRPREPKGEPYEPQLAIWFGTLDERERALHLFDPSLDQSEPPDGGKFVKVGLERGHKHKVELRWLPDPGAGTARIEVIVDDSPVLDVQGAVAGGKQKDVVQVCSLTALQVNSLEIKARLLE